MSSSQTANKPRTFGSGPYLDGLLRQAERMDAELQADICARIKQARKERGYTLEEIADLLDITVRAYQYYEKSRVPFRKLTRMAELFRVSEPWLLHGAMPEPEHPGVAEILARLAELEAKLDRLADLQEQGNRATDERLAAVELALKALVDQGQSAADG